MEHNIFFIVHRTEHMEHTKTGTRSIIGNIIEHNFLLNTGQRTWEQGTRSIIEHHREHNGRET